MQPETIASWFIILRKQYIYWQPYTAGALMEHTCVLYHTLPCIMCCLVVPPGGPGSVFVDSFMVSMYSNTACQPWHAEVIVKCNLEWIYVIKLVLRDDPLREVQISRKLQFSLSCGYRTVLLYCIITARMTVMQWQVTKYSIILVRGNPLNTTV